MISYIYKENGGVNSAWNVGVQNAQGEYFFRCDSDDYLSDDCIKTIDDLVRNINNEENVYGICGLCSDFDGNIIGSKFKNELFIGSSLELRFNESIVGEKAGCFKTKILKQFLYPDLSQYTKFIFESYLWNRTDQEYNTLFTNHILKVYNSNSPDSITMGLRDYNENYIFSRLFQCYDDIKTIPNYLKMKKYYFSYKVLQLAKWSVIYHKFKRNYKINDALTTLYSKFVFKCGMLFYKIKYLFK